MRTNIVIDEKLMADAMKAGPYKTKKDAVKAGLKLLDFGWSIRPFKLKIA